MIKLLSLLLDYFSSLLAIIKITELRLDEKS